MIRFYMIWFLFFVFTHCKIVFTIVNSVFKVKLQKSSKWFVWRVSVKLFLLYYAKLCLMFMVCGKVGMFLQVLYMSLDQYDQENFRAHIIMAACGLVSKPQQQPPFWVFHYFTHYVYVLSCSTEILSGIVLNLFMVDPCDFVDLFDNCPCGHHIPYFL